MATQGVTTSNSSALLAAEVLVEQIGLELAQRVNTPETVWVKNLENQKSATAHYRWENAFSTSTLTSAQEGFVPTSYGQYGLPQGSWSISEQTITTALEGQSIPVGVQIMSLDPEALASVSRQTSTVLARAIDASVCALYPSFTSNTAVGSSGNALTVSHILTANAELDAVHADNIGSYQGRLAPHQFLNLYQDVMSKNFGIAKVSVDAMGQDQITVGTTVLKKNTFVPTINSGANYSGGIYVYQAIGLVLGMAPQVQINYLPGSGQYFVDGYLSLGSAICRNNLGVAVVSGVSA